MMTDKELKEAMELYKKAEVAHKEADAKFKNAKKVLHNELEARGVSKVVIDDMCLADTTYTQTKMDTERFKAEMGMDCFEEFAKTVVCHRITVL